MLNSTKKKRIRPKYRGVNDPSIAKTYCPHCKASKGTPCRTLASNNHAFRPYTETHMARVKEAEKIENHVCSKEPCEFCYMRGLKHYPMKEQKLRMQRRK
jgi:hypothetical protein